MRFGSVCSGIEAASAAWGVLGWRAAWFSEIEPFPSAVLSHHYPDVPNLGDMTTLPDRIRGGEVEAPDVFCGGTPCQAFSVAGLRRSLDDARGNLSLTFCEIADAIDDVRLAGGEPASIVFWENVPGVLSTRDNAFGCFLARLCGGDEPLHAPDGWPDAGCVSGPTRTAAWRVLDAQYFGLAQRRRRVFVVASAREGFDPAAVLLEFEGVRRDSAPSREAGEGATGGATPSFGIRSANTKANGWGIQRELTHTLDTASPQIVAQAFGGGQNCARTDVSTALSAHPGGSRLDFQTETFVAHTLRGEGFDASEDGTVRGTQLVPLAMRESGQGYWMQDEIAGTLRAEGEDRPSRPSHVIGVPVPMINMQGSKGNAVAQADGPSFTLNAMHGHDMHAVAVPVAFHPTQDPISSTDGTTHAMGAGSKGGCATVAVAQPYTLAIRGRGDSHNLEYRQDGTANALLTPNGGRGGIGVGAIAYAQNQRDEVRTMDVAGALAAEPGAKQQTYIAFTAKDHGGDATADLAPTLRAMNHADSHANGGGQMAVLAPTLTASNDPSRSPQSSEVTAQVAAVVQATAVAFDPYNQACAPVTHTLRKGHSATGDEIPQTITNMQVRRLTPTECERLQGFPGGYTAIPWRGKPASECPDGPRYKALGNSWAVPVVRWIGRRIDAAL